MKSLRRCLKNKYLQFIRLSCIIILSCFFNLLRKTDCKTGKQVACRGQDRNRRNPDRGRKPSVSYTYLFFNDHRNRRNPDRGRKHVTIQQKPYCNLIEIEETPIGDENTL